jgi:hypothetical protein
VVFPGLFTRKRFGLAFHVWLSPEVGKATLKINGDEALSDESL